MNFYYYLNNILNLFHLYDHYHIYILYNIYFFSINSIKGILLHSLYKDKYNYHFKPKNSIHLSVNIYFNSKKILVNILKKKKLKKYFISDC